MKKFIVALLALIVAVPVFVGAVVVGLSKLFASAIDLAELP